MRAVVVGGTGAIGKHIVSQLLERDAWETVVTIGRRPVPEPPGNHGNKLQQVVVDMDQLSSSPEAAAAFRGADAVFCALGTTRAVAGSAAAFNKVDRDYVAASAQLARVAVVRYFGLVTAAGANAKVWAADFAPLHPLLYARTKGEAEQAVLSERIPATSIFRPGLLDRGDAARGMEKMMFSLGLFSSIKVEDVARCMVLDAERRLGPSSKDEPDGWVVYEMKPLQKAAAAGAAPEGRLERHVLKAAGGQADHVPPPN